jgi:A/G-specific adenine glycosylase
MQGMAGRRQTRQVGSEAFWVAPLMEWFAAHKRDMPWRGNPDPYAVWVSEIMLQQTQVATVMPYFRRFMRRFPTVRKLAEADQQEVLKAWEGLGYYTRARNLHRAAREVLREFGGRVPETSAALRSLPGIGPYTAAAIASIAFGESVPVVDGNVVRVVARLRGIQQDSTRPAVRAGMAAYLAAHLPADRAGDFNQALMELGALVCRPRDPACPACPLSPGCVARRKGWTARLPVRPTKKAVPHIEVAACVIRKGGKVLIAQRRPDQMLGGLWEFPGGKRHPGETIQDTGRREIMEELGLEIEVGREICRVNHAYSHFTMTLHALECRPLKGRPRPIDCAAVKWVPEKRLRDYPFPGADRRVLATLEAEDR